MVGGSSIWQSHELSVITMNYVITFLSALDTYILSRGTFTHQESPNGSVRLSKGRFDSSKPISLQQKGVDGMAPCWPCCLALSRTGCRNVSRPWDAGNWLNIMTVLQELKV